MTTPLLDKTSERAANEYDFDLFISYKREPDRPLAKRIESFLEGFHKTVPAPTDLPGGPSSRRVIEPLNVCLDGSDFSLPAPHATGEQVRRDVDGVIYSHLARCRELLVLCSKAAVQSVFVQREIAWFLEHRGENFVRLVLTEGRDPMTEPEQYIPAALLERGFATRACYDMRGFRKTEAKAWARVDECEREMVRLAGDLVGLPAGSIYPSWIREQRLRQAKNRWALRAGVASFAAVGMVAVTLWQRSEKEAAERQVAVAEASRATLARSAAEARAETATAQQKEAESTAQAQKELANAAAERADLEAREAGLARREQKLAEQRQKAEATLRGAAQANLLLYRRPEQAFLVADAALAGSPDLAAQQVASQARDAAMRIMSMRQHVRKLDASQWDTGLAYIAPTFFIGKISAKLSRSGQHVLMTTERSGDAGSADKDSGGASSLGDAYLLDNTTMKLVKLQAPSYKSPFSLKRRLEYTGFSSSGSRIYVARQLDIEAYDEEGNYLDAFRGGGNGTKYPITAVDSVRNDEWIVYGDSDGSFITLPFQFDMNKVRTLHRDSRNPVLQIETSPSGAYTAFVRQNGQAYIWQVGVNDSKGVRKLVQPGIVSLAFDPKSSPDRLATGGSDGAVTLWSIDAKGPSELRTIRHGFSSVGYVTFTDDGARLLTVSEDLSARVWDVASGRLLERTNPDRGDNRNAIVKPQRMEGAAAVSRQIDTAAGIPLSELQGIHDVASTPAGTFLLARKKELFATAFDAYAVVDERAVLLRDDVVEIVADTDDVWLRTGSSREAGSIFGSSDGPAWKVRAQPLSLMQPVSDNASQVVLHEGHAWLLTRTQLVIVAGEQRFSFAPADLAARRIIRSGTTLWLSADQGLYRAEGLNAVRVTSVPMDATGMRQVGHDWWITTQSKVGDKSDAGAAYRLRGSELAAIPDEDTRVHDLLEAKGRTWLGTSRGVYAVASDKTSRISGCEGPARRLIETSDALWALVGNPDQTSHACRITKSDGRMFDIRGADISGVRHAGGSTWLLTSGKTSGEGVAYKVKGGSLVLMPASDAVSLIEHEGAPNDVLACQNKVWMATSRGLLLIENGQVERIEGVPTDAQKLAVFDGALWVTTGSGVFRGDGRTFSRVAPDEGVSELKPMTIGGRDYLLLGQPRYFRLLPQTAVAASSGAGAAQAMFESDGCVAKAR